MTSELFERKIMKRIFLVLLATCFVAGTSGCSCSGVAGGGFGSRLSNFGSNFGNNFSGNLGSNFGGGFGGSQGALPSLQDGPLRRWLRGDACDSCNVPAGQITFDSGFDTSCSTGLCNAPVGETVLGAPIVPPSSPVTTGYAPLSNEIPLESSGQPVGPPVIGFGNEPFNATDIYGGGSDSIVIPPLGN